MEVLAKQRKKLLNLQWLQQVLSYPALGLKVPQSGWSLFIITWIPDAPHSNELLCTHSATLHAPTHPVTLVKPPLFEVA